MALATLSIDIVAQLAKFEQSLDGVGDAVKRMTDKVAGFGTIFAANLLSSAAEEAISTIASLPGALMDSVAAYQDFAEQTGTTAAGFASLQTAMDASGASAEQVAGAMVKLTANLSKTSDESKGTGAALKAIGLDLEAFRKLKPEDQLQAVADALANFKDGAGKTAVAVALFGKEGAKLLPFLNDLEELRKNPFLTDEQIDAVDAFGKRSAAAAGQVRQLAQVAAAQAIPAMDAFQQASIEAIKALVGIDQQTGKLAKNGDVSEFAERCAKALGVVVDIGQLVYRTFAVVGNGLGALAAASASVVAGEFSSARTILRQFVEDADAIVRGTLFSTRLQAKLDEIKKAGAQKAKGAAEDDKRPGIDFTAPDKEAEKTAKKAQEAYEKLTAAIKAKTDAQDAEIDMGRKLTDGEAFLLDMEKRLAESKTVLGPLQYESAKSYLETHKAAVLLREDALSNLFVSQKNAEAFIKQAEAAYKATEVLDFERSLIGKTSDAQRDLSEQRETDLLTRKLVSAEARLELPLHDEERQSLQALADTLREQIAARKALSAERRRQSEDPIAGAQSALEQFLEESKNAGDQVAKATDKALHGLEDGMVDFLKTGKLGFKSLVDGIIEDFLRLQVVKPLLNSLLGDGKGGVSGGVTSFFASLFGGARAEGGPVKAGVPYLVGEKGPELLVPTGSGTIVPNKALRPSGAPTINLAPVYNIGQGVNRSEVVAAVEASNQKLKADILRSMRRGGSFAQ